ncbi:MAG: hypothetical protein K5637_03585 [Lachnospiraceae bacterium]|nr:hypothetical protein [Lachnospiraceae bacterium]
MSYRPTISVYIDGHIADIGYYRNWDDEDLFYEAVAIAALFSGCGSVYEFNEKKYGRQKVYILVEPEVFENKEEDLKFFEFCSEWPILVDLTSRCIYISEGAKGKEELLAAPRISYEELFSLKAPKGGVLSLEQADMEGLLKLFLKYEDLRHHLSAETAGLLEKERERSKLS